MAVLRLNAPSVLETPIWKKMTAFDSLILNAFKINGRRNKRNVIQAYDDDDNDDKPNLCNFLDQWHAHLLWYRYELLKCECWNASYQIPSVRVG